MNQKRSITEVLTSRTGPVLLLYVLLSSCAAPPRNQDGTASPAPSKEFKIGIQMSPAMALVMVAEDQGFFEKQGAKVKLEQFTAGKFALQAFLGGSLDFAVAGEVPVTLSTLQGSSFKVLTQVVEQTTNEVRVVVRKDASASDPASFFRAKRRKLATSFGGGPEFFTYSFLRAYDIDQKQVEIISQKPEDMPASLANGSVDAVAIFDPFAYFAERQLKDKGVTFSDPKLYSELYVMTVQQATLDQYPDLAPKLLRALLQARDFIRGNPQKSKEIVSRYTKLDSETLDAIWGNFKFAPALNRRLLDYQNLQAAWAKSKGTVSADTPTPDFASRLVPHILRSLDATAVQLGN